MMVRSSLAKLARVSRGAVRVPYTAPNSHVRNFSRSTFCRDEPKMPELDEEQIAKLVNNPLVSKLSKSPRTLNALKETTTLMARKGYTGSPGLVKQMRLLMDSEVKSKMIELKTILDEEGIELRQEDMSELFKVMGLENINK